MKRELSRREFVQWAGAALVGAPFARLFSVRSASAATGDEAAGAFYFVQMSDTHWGYDKPEVNPDFRGTLKKAIAAVNALPQPPDFVVFTGDLTHTTDDPKVRRARMTEFQAIVAELKAPRRYFLPGEHDAALDRGAAYHEIFGESRYSFDHKNVHFIAIDNVSDPHGAVGDQQLAWLRDDLKARGKDDRLIVLTHRPLFDLAPDWDWATADGAKVIDLLTPFRNVCALYGHIHQTNHHETGRITHDSAMGLMYPLPAPHSVPAKSPIKWDPAQPYRGLGFRDAEYVAAPGNLKLVEHPLAGADLYGETVQRIAITAKRFEFVPREVSVRKGATVALVLTSADVDHGFSCPDLNIRADIPAKQTVELPFKAEKIGRHPFHCDVFCGEGHQEMSGAIIVGE